MSNKCKLNLVVDYLRYVLDIPDFYSFLSHSSSFDGFFLYAVIDDCKIYLRGSDEFKPKMRINDIIRVTDGNLIYDLLISLDDYSILILNDIIKTLGGVIYEKATLQY